MGRRKKRRMVHQEPDATFYKPQGIPMHKLKSATITYEDLEALRLADAEGLSQADGAQVMGVSRATFGRILCAARSIVATALTNGLAIRIEGGHYTLTCKGASCPKMQADNSSTTNGEEAMPGMNGNGPGAGGGGRCMGGQGRGMGQGQGQGRKSGQGRCVGGQGRGMGGGGRGMGGQGMGGGNAGMSRAMGTDNSPRQTNTTQQFKDTTVKKIAITSEGPTLGDKVDPRFGRAGGFVIVDLDTMGVEYVDNGSSQAMAQGAGIQAAENVANAGAQVLLTGYVGPKAFTALQAAGIKIGQDVDGMTVGEAVEKFKNGEVPMADNANAQSGGNK
nr:NifB/NifX family molybdenum-iron cluster-binding protein [uncultured Pseudodesulfovibrio sp.]